MMPDEFATYANSACEAQPLEPILNRLREMAGVSNRCVGRLGTIHERLTGDGCPESECFDTDSPLSVEWLAQTIERDLRGIQSRIEDVLSRIGG
jgi:hypothetical protein